MRDDMTPLFQPIKIGNMDLRNRIVMAPMATAYARSSAVSQQLLDYYVERAKGGIGLIITEPACIDVPLGLGVYMPNMDLPILSIDTDDSVGKLQQLPTEVHKHGAKIALQLMHAGRYARMKLAGLQPVAPSAIASKYTGEMPRELTTAEVEEIIDKFAQASRRARDAGFDAIELLSATGYLISEFLSPVTNKRTDRFGGNSPEERSLFLTEIIKQVRAEVGPDFPICCKLSIDEFLPGGNTIEDSKIISRKIEEAGGNIIHAWAGWHESPVAMLPMSVERGAFVYLAEAMKQAVSLPVMAVCRINDPIMAAQIIADGKADLVAMGRPLLADPHLPNKAASGNLDNIRMCFACCRCFEDLFFSLQCSVNAELGKEGEHLLQPATTSKKILVVGGGPAGMEAARVAALRGHRVTLWEKSYRLGGALLLAAVPPHKGEINTVTSYLVHQIHKLGVNVELNKEANAETILAEEADEVIIAIGAFTATSDISGADMDHVMTTIDVIEGRNTGNEVVVVGGGIISCEVAELLIQQDKKVTITSRQDKIATDVGGVTRWVIMQRLREMGVVMLTSATPKQITAEGIIVERGGESTLIQANSIVLASGFTSDKKLPGILQEKLPRLKVVGDCLQPNRILEAIHSGWRAGCEV